MLNAWGNIVSTNSLTASMNRSRICRSGKLYRLGNADPIHLAIKSHFKVLQPSALRPSSGLSSVDNPASLSVA